MPFETISVTVGAGSANPQTKTLTVNVDPTTGSGSGSVSFTGVNGGLDTIKATGTLAGTPYTSNVAEVAWQVCPSVISLGPVTLNEFNNDFGGGTWHGFGGQNITDLVFNSVIINQVVNNAPIQGIISPDLNNGEAFLQPPHVDQVKSDGTALTPEGTSLGVTPVGVTILRGHFVVRTAGIHTLYFLVDDSWGLYIGGGATRSQGTYVPNFGDGGGGSPLTFDSLPLVATRNTAAAPNQPTDFVYVNFPAPGVYAFTMWWNNANDVEAYFQSTFNAGAAQLPSGQQIIGNVMLPVALQPTPPPTTPLGNLQLSIANGNLHVVGDTVTLNVGVNGIHYSVKPYIPLFEGQTGHLYIYNDPSNPTFTFPQFNGQNVDKPAAAPKVFQIVGSNGSWQGRVSVIYDSGAGKFELNYNGNTFDPHVDITAITVQDDDIAWFDSVLKTFDLFTPSVNGGGNFFPIEIDYMVKPAVASVSPLSVPADGASHVFTISLDRPFSPQQQGAFNTGNVVNLPVITFPGATLIGTPSGIIDSAGWLTGWNVPITVPSATNNSSVPLGITLTGTLTRLVNDGFVTGSVTYIATSPAASITLIGQAFTPPSISAFSVSPVSGSAPSFSITSGANETLSATVSSSFNNAITCAFWRQQHGTSNRVNMGNGTLTNSFSSGGLFYKVFTFSQLDTSWYDVNDLGAQATDTVSGLQSNLFFDSSTYTLTGGAGGGGEGCPAVEMYLGALDQVADCQVGYPVVTLEEDPSHYLGEHSLDDSRGLSPVESISYSTEICYHFIAENGAEVVVSRSTPVPTRETLIAVAEGHPIDQLPTFASQILVGMTVITEIGDHMEWSILKEVTCVGSRKVARLYCGGRNFAAGVQPGKYIFTHNVAPIVK